MENIEEDVIPTALFIASLQLFILSAWNVEVQIEFPIGDGQVYRRWMQITDIQDGENGYECKVLGYGVTLIPYGSSFRVVSP